MLDFVAEYANRSDDELRLLIKDRGDLVPRAQIALDAEIARRLPNGFQTEVDDGPFAQPDPEQHDCVVVYSRSLIFPHICPNCATSASDYVRISCASDFVETFFPIIRIWRYLFSRYRVPFCAACANAISIRKWLQITFFFVALALTVYIAQHAHSWRLAFFVTLSVLYGIGGLLWKLTHLSERWPPPAIEILSSWSANERCVQLENAEYRAAFLQANRKQPGRG